MKCQLDLIPKRITTLIIIEIILILIEIVILILIEIIDLLNLISHPIIDLEENNTQFICLKKSLQHLS